MEDTMRHAFIVVAAAALISAVPAMAQEKDTRAGSCEDAKSQVEYFCNGKGNPNDIMVQAPIACNNAKKNMAAACEGKVEADKKYEFKDR
jgi:hypothetical protein